MLIKIYTEMKQNIRYYLIILFLAVSTISCQDDYLERYPLDAMSDETFFASVTDLKSYMNGMYGNLVRKQSATRWKNLEDGSDNWVSESPNGSLMQHSATGEAPATSGTWNSWYDYIRKTNYFLENASRVPEDNKSKHYVGEGYYARAYAYFMLLQTYGGVPYFDKVLNVGSEELYSTRESRDFVATKIIEDLDKAIDGLDWKGEGEAVAQRLNKQAALILKTRVSLYEGSWEYYHENKSTPFAVSGKNGSEFLNEAVNAAEILMAHEGANIFNGPAGWEYFELFRKVDYSNVPGAYLYFAYDRGFQITQNYIDEIGRGGHGALTKSVLDAYLMKDGKPAGISDIELDELSQASYGINKDPRLRQSIYTPDRGVLTTYFTDGGQIANILPIRFTGIRNTNQEREVGPSGIRVWKGLSFDEVEWRNGEVDDLIFRYAEGLLNYAEAKAILGTITQADLDKSVNLLRARVGMTHMNLGEVNSWNFTYTERDGYDPSAPNIVNEIRRERRVELLLEGFRKTDIKRWALLAEVFNGRKPLGAPAQELADYWNNGDGLIADGWGANAITSVTMTLGIQYDVDISGNYINPYYLNSDFDESGRGYFVEPSRDYLSGVPKDEIELYEEKGGVTLEQNPGWF